MRVHHVFQEPKAFVQSVKFIPVRAGCSFPTVAAGALQQQELSPEHPKHRCCVTLAMQRGSSFSAVICSELERGISKNLADREGVQRLEKRELPMGIELSVA